MSTALFCMSMNTISPNVKTFALKKNSQGFLKSSPFTSSLVSGLWNRVLTDAAACAEYGGQGAVLLVNNAFLHCTGVT